MANNFNIKNKNIFLLLKEKSFLVYEKFFSENENLKKISNIKNKEIFPKFLIFYFFDHGHFLNKLIDDYLKDKIEIEQNIIFLKTQFYSFKLKDFSFYYFRKTYDFFEIKIENYNTLKQLEYFTNLTSVMQIPIIHYIDFNNKNFFVDNKDFYILTKIKDINEQNVYIDILLNMI